jgi:SAM-dependent methyltransferase
MSIDPPPQSLSEWFTTAPLGQYVLAREQAYHDAAVVDAFGFHALQLGLPEHDFLRANRIPFKCQVAPRGAALRAQFHDLPIASNSIDLLLLPHVLEFSAQPHQILREAHRVLMPEGQLVISGFNPWSLWGMRHFFNRMYEAYPWRGRFIHLPRLKDWLKLLDMEIEAGQMSCYVPPCAQAKWLHRFDFMEDAGDRWWPIAGGVYFLRAIKRVRGMRVIVPKRSEALVAKRRLVAVPRNVAEQEALVARDTGDVQ